LTESCFDVERLLVLGSIEYQSQQGDWGQSLFERAIELDPKNPEAYEALGRIHLDRGNGEKAQKLFGKALELPGASALAFVY